jgi:hypothetical protein
VVRVNDVEKPAVVYIDFDYAGAGGPSDGWTGRTIDVANIFTRSIRVLDDKVTVIGDVNKLNVFGSLVYNTGYKR